MTFHNSSTCKGIVGFRVYVKKEDVLIRYAITEDAKTRVFLNNNKDWLICCGIGEIEEEFQVGYIFRCHNQALFDVRFLDFINIFKMLVMIKDKGSVDISVRKFKKFKSYVDLKKFKLKFSYKIETDKITKILCLIPIFRRRLIRYKKKIKT